MSQFQHKLENAIEEINKISQRIISNDEISEIELDILLDKLRDTYSFILSRPIDKEEEEAVIEEEMVVVEQKIEEEQIEEEIIKEELLAEEEEEIIEEKIEEVKVVDTPSVLRYLNESMPINTQIKIEKKEIEPVIEEIQKEELIVEEQIEIKEEAKVGNSNYDLFAEKSQSTLAEKYQKSNNSLENITQTPNTIDINQRFKQNNADLRTAIGVNEKFMFINDLFSGNLREYTEFIQRLNESGSLENAKKIIQEAKERRKWVASSLSFTTLENVISRSFR
ncbi:MAG: hypothetical protein H6Q15_1880 [Bacteroidetes bacterium]|nr:hypothetical protein [Bacteroidota bacterium]